MFIRAAPSQIGALDAALTAFDQAIAAQQTPQDALQQILEMHAYAGGRIQPVQGATMLDLLPVPAWVSGDDGHAVYFNRAWLEFTGRKLGSELGKGWTKSIHPDDFPERRRLHWRALIRQEPWQAEYRMLSSANEYKWVEEKGSPIFTRGNTLAGFIATCNDISAHKVQSMRIEEESKRHEYDKFHDNLTGLYNQRYLEDRMTDYAGRESIFPVSIIIADLDGLKAVNDRQGHLEGDKLIKGAASILKSSFRPDDTIARYGGDEFVVLLARAEYEQAQQALARVRKNMAAHNQSIAAYNQSMAAHNQSASLPVSMSLGAATAFQSSELTNAFSLADRFMYEDKRARKAGRDHLPHN